MMLSVSISLKVCTGLSPFVNRNIEKDKNRHGPIKVLPSIAREVDCRRCVIGWNGVVYGTAFFYINSSPCFTLAIGKL